MRFASWFSSSLAFALLWAFVPSSWAESTKSATFDCDGGPDAGGFSMVATYYFPPGGHTPNKAAVMLDGKATELTIRSHDDASGWTFYSTTPEISFRWVGTAVALYLGPKPSKCVERAAAPPIPAASNQPGSKTTSHDAPAQVGGASGSGGTDSATAAPQSVPAEPAAEDCDAIKSAFLQMQCKFKQASGKTP